MTGNAGGVAADVLMGTQQGWLSQPFSAFDTETTGVDVETARVVSACLIDIKPGELPSPTNWLINPGIHIPEEATQIHGITNEIAQAFGRPPEECLQEISDHFQMRDHLIVGYNIRYDLTVLWHELTRFGENPMFLTKLLCVDPFVLDKKFDPYRKGSRKLADTCVHYGVNPGDSHSAEDDALAAARLAWKLCRKIPSLLTMDAPGLHRLQVGAYKDWATRFQEYLRREQPDATVGTQWPLEIS